MKTLILLLTIAACSSCTITSNPDGSFNASVDPDTASAIAAKVYSTK